MTQLWPYKDPDEVLDYDIDWTDRLAGDTIVTSAWTSDSVNITINSDIASAAATKVWLSAGVLGEQYVLTNRITTADGRTMDQSVKLRIKAK